MDYCDYCGLSFDYCICDLDVNQDDYWDEYENDDNKYNND
jgi:hypothetical protein